MIRQSCALLALAILLNATAARAATPTPRVTGPLAVTASSYPFGAAHQERIPEDLRAIGYVEEEFLMSGLANVYDWPQPGPAVVRHPDAPYSTRVLVRRPADRARFSGNAIVEMLNPSNLFDLNLAWAVSHRQIVRNGDAWIGITAKPVSIATLKTFDPARYASLSWANPIPEADPRNCSTVATDSSRTTENGLVWDIYSQTGAWLKSRDRSNPLLYGATGNATHPVQHLYAWGYSQTGSYLYTYVNAIHPRVVQSDGRPMFDAFLVAVSSGPTPINQCASPIPAGDARRFMTNAGVPVVRVMSGSDYLSGIAARRPDADTSSDRYRNYEIAGSGHATPDELNFAAKPADIEKGGRAVPPMACNEGPRSRFPNGPAFNAILRNLDEWVRRGTPAPHGDPIRVADGKAVLDPDGNMTGGIRSPYVDAPTSTWYGNSTGPSFCRIAGHEVPFEPAEVRSRYASADAYVSAVTASVNRLVNERWIVRQDGDQLIEDARQAARTLFGK